MKYIIVALILILGTSIVWAEESARETYSINPTFQPWEMRDYKVEAAVKGKILMPDSTALTDVDIAVSYKIRHKYTRREGDGLLPLEISLVEGQITTGGQKLAITPMLYPKLTVLLDKQWHISDIFGPSDSQLAQSLPGINYNNLIMLFYVPDIEKPHAIGDKWESTVKLPSYGETYGFVNTLKSIDTIDGIKAATIHQELTRLPKPDEKETSTMKAVVDSSFALDSGKLLKSHIESKIKFAGKNKDEADPYTNSTIDISLAK